MCGRFVQSQTREEYLAYLAEEAERDIAFDPEPIGRYNVAPIPLALYIKCLPVEGKLQIIAPSDLLTTSYQA